jgi:hypothetical protein
MPTPAPALRLRRLSVPSPSPEMRGRSAGWFLGRRALKQGPEESRLYFFSRDLQPEFPVGALSQIFFIMILSQIFSIGIVKQNVFIGIINQNYVKGIALNVWIENPYEKYFDWEPLKKKCD